MTLLACLSHDVGHPGLTNNFLVETGHELAIRYNDASPLENMHAAVALNLAKPYLRTRPSTDQKQNRALWIGLLLATDMKEHSQQIFELERALAKAKERGTSYEACTPEHHVPCLKIFIHCCDISNPAKPWPVYRRWTALVMEEFWRQAELEKERGCPDGARARPRPRPVPKGFIAFIRPCSPPPPHRRRDMVCRGADDTARRWQTPGRASKTTMAMARAGAAASSCARVPVSGLEVPLARTALDDAALGRRRRRRERGLPVSAPASERSRNRSRRVAASRCRWTAGSM